MHTEFYVRRLKERNCLEGYYEDWFEWNVYEIDASSSGQDPLSHVIKSGNKFSGLIKGNKFLDDLRGYQLISVLFNWFLHYLTLFGIQSSLLGQTAGSKDLHTPTFRRPTPSHHPDGGDGVGL
jgi:hypothetical protein